MSFVVRFPSNIEKALASFSSKELIAKREAVRNGLKRFQASMELHGDEILLNGVPFTREELGMDNKNQKNPKDPKDPKDPPPMEKKEKSGEHVQSVKRLEEILGTSNTEEEKFNKLVQCISRVELGEEWAEIFYLFSTIKVQKNVLRLLCDLNKIPTETSMLFNLFHRLSSGTELGLYCIEVFLQSSSMKIDNAEELKNLVCALNVGGSKWQTKENLLHLANRCSFPVQGTEVVFVVGCMVEGQQENAFNPFLNSLKEFKKTDWISLNGFLSLDQQVKILKSLEPKMSPVDFKESFAEVKEKVASALKSDKDAIFLHYHSKKIKLHLGHLKPNAKLVVQFGKQKVLLEHKYGSVSLSGDKIHFSTVPYSDLHSIETHFDGDGHRVISGDFQLDAKGNFTGSGSVSACAFTSLEEMQDFLQGKSAKKKEISWKDYPIQSEKKQNNLIVGQENECLVCVENPSMGVFVPCGHVCCCLTCGEKLDTCPLCRDQGLFMCIGDIELVEGQRLFS
jgi:hypothetical protein